MKGDSLMQAHGSLSPEQKSVPGTVFHLLEGVQVYPIACETNQRLLEGMLKLGEICMKRLPQYFAELQRLADEWKK